MNPLSVNLLSLSTPAAISILSTVLNETIRRVNTLEASVDALHSANKTLETSMGLLKAELDPLRANRLVPVNPKSLIEAGQRLANRRYKAAFNRGDYRLIIMTLPYCCNFVFQHAFPSTLSEKEQDEAFSAVRTTIENHRNKARVDLETLLFQEMRLLHPPPKQATGKSPTYPYTEVFRFVIDRVLIDIIHRNRLEVTTLWKAHILSVNDAQRAHDETLKAHDDEKLKSSHSDDLSKSKTERDADLEIRLAALELELLTWFFCQMPSAYHLWVRRLICKLLDDQELCNRIKAVRPEVAKYPVPIPSETEFDSLNLDIYVASDDSDGEEEETDDPTRKALR